METISPPTASDHLLALRSAAEFEQLLRKLSGIDAALEQRTNAAVSELLAQVGSESTWTASEVARRFYGKVNEKLDLNRDARAAIYARSAQKGWTFNFPQKKRIASLVDRNDMKTMRGCLKSYGVSPALADELIAACQPVTPQETRAALKGEVEKPSKLRKAHARQVAEDVFSSSAGALAWALWEPELLYGAFGGGGSGITAHDYMSYLQSLQPHLFNRDRTLAIRLLNPEGGSRQNLRDEVCAWIASEYEALANHGFLALAVDAANAQAAWRIVNDATLYAERFKGEALKQMYFRWRMVETETCEHVPGVAENDPQFEVLCEGFTYRDLFVLQDEAGKVQRLVLVMQKNMRDETRIPCPTCRGTQIEGNSYPAFGVRSWECKNSLCAGRSIYNRGYRFQFRSVIQQAAIEDPRNEIDEESVNRWRKDVLRFESDHEIIDTLVRHYSICDDGVAVMGATVPSMLRGRSVSTLPPERTTADPQDFWDGPFFRRFIARSEQHDNVPGPSRSIPEGESRFEVANGDSTGVLLEYPAGSADRAVTSPPYFNAREYSQWPNLYTYLYDMYRNALSVYHALRPGAIYAFNIFDYFDNERIVTFSDMGRKRIPLGALMSEVFERIGYELLGVVPWDKGDIHGKRGFNGGNYSPYYQAPFNCWEHVLVLRKPAADDETERGDAVSVGTTLRIAPVFKMVKGKNTYGHTAPYPEDLVTAFLGDLPSGSVVLDPFAGSGTTGRAALRNGQRALLVELDQSYAALAERRCRELTNEQASMLPLD